MNRFDGRVALITGAASGLGEASAHRLGGEGAKVVIWDRDTQALAKAQRKAEGAGRDVLSRFQRPCLLCSEPDADQCHRRLVAEWWKKHLPSITIVHL